jgi:predicted RecA/RadA family phage recombinase
MVHLVGRTQVHQLMELHKDITTQQHLVKQLSQVQITMVTHLTYDAGYIDVYLNGVKLLNGTDVTVTSGSSVVLASGATTGDVVDIVAYGTFSVASLNADNLDSGTVPDARITGAYTGITNLTMSGDLTVDTNTLKVDSTNNRVGIGTTSPTS